MGDNKVAFWSPACRGDDYHPGAPWVCVLPVWEPLFLITGSSQYRLNNSHISYVPDLYEKRGPLPRPRLAAKQEFAEREKPRE